jgi:hypothetical protein
LNLIPEQKKEKENPLPSKYYPESISSLEESSPPLIRHSRQVDKTIPIPKYPQNNFEVVLHLKDVYFAGVRQETKRIEFCEQETIKLIIHHKDAYTPIFLRLSKSVEISVCLEKSTIVLNILLEPDIFFDGTCRFVVLKFENSGDGFKEQYQNLLKKYKMFQEISKLIS